MAAARGRRAAASVVQPAAPDLVVGIDFGTHGSGAAYHHFSLDIGATPQLITTWPLQPRTGNAKTRTLLLYQDGLPVAFGHQAKADYAAVPEAQLYRYQLVDGAALKLALQDMARAPPGTLPPGVTPSAAAADYLTLMHRWAVRHCLMGGKAPGTGPSCRSLIWMADLTSLLNGATRDPACCCAAAYTGSTVM